MKSRKLIRRILFSLAAIVLAAGAIAPMLNANRFHGQIRSALEAALNRRVTIGKVKFSVFAGPGFTVENVIIDDAPGMGAEPFAHVESVEARVHLASLWTGRLSFSNLKLVEPSVNFVKSGSGPWNIQPWLNRAGSANATPRDIQIPEIQIRDGRLNFKFGDTKSVFYLSGADLDLYPNQQGDLVIRFSGEPARTDHTAQGLGRLVARGVLKASGANHDAISMSVQLERTAIQEVARLFGIQDLGVRGAVASNLQLEGPLSHINASGDIRIEDIHRWDLMPTKGEGWTLNYTGYVNLPGQHVEIETKPGDVQGTPVNGKFVASNYLTAARWQASLTLRDVPAARLVDTARSMGAPLPPGATVDAKLNGEIAYAQPEGFRGQLVLNKASFKFPQGGVVEFESAPLEIANNQFHFGPAEISLEDSQTARVEAGYSLTRRELSLGLETKLLAIAQTRDLASRVLGAGAIPFLDRCGTGTWKGALAYERRDEALGDAGRWTGNLELQNATIELAGFGQPVRLNSAVVQIQPDHIQISRLHARAGSLPFDADYRYFLDPRRPDRLRLFLGDVQVADLEKLLAPTLNRDRGILARALQLGRPRVPDWLAQRNVDLALQIRTLRAGDLALGAFKSRAVWSGSSVRFSGIDIKQGDMTGAGKLDVDLKASNPVYQLAGQLHSLGYHEGTLDLEGSLETSGTGGDLAANVKSEGTFSGTAILLSADAQIDEISGEYKLEPAVLGARLNLSKVQLSQGSNLYRGQGASQSDGHLVLELSSGGKQVKMSGMLFQARPAAP